LLRPKKDPRKDTKILPKKLIFGAKNAKDIFVQLGFSSDGVMPDKKSSSI
jgi:hypothetical protein